jgi:hypothetical protein
MANKVREVQVKNVGSVFIAYVYRGFYCIKGGERAFHTSNIVRNGTNVDNVKDDDEFNLAHGRFDTPEFFKETVDEHIEYIQRAFGSLRRYFRLNSGENDY